MKALEEENELSDETPESNQRTDDYNNDEDDEVD